MFEYFSSLGLSTQLSITAGAAFVLGIGMSILIARIRRRIRRARVLARLRRRKEVARAKAQYLDANRLREVYKMLTDLTATLNYQRVLDMALDLGIQALTPFSDTPDRLVAMVLLFSKKEVEQPELYIGASRRLTAADLHQTFLGTQGLLQKVIEEGTAKVSHNIANDPELGRVIAFQSCRSAYCIPLRQGIDTYGALVFVHPRPNFFGPAHREVLNLIAKQAIISIQNARLYQDLEQEKERMTEIQEEARKKLARDLHDGPTQSIAAIAMRINFARRLIERNQEAAAEELFKIEDLARHTTKEIRHMLFTLRPLVLESKGLPAALQSMAEKISETYDQNVALDINADILSALGLDKQGVIFYIIEEAVTNARKHAKADQIWVRLKPIDTDLALLEIADNGVGFDVKSMSASYERRGSLGMINLQERTDLINGVLRVHSTPGKGTSVQVVIPLTEDAIDRIRHSV
jgi:signal transduction histidine kinase